LQMFMKEEPMKYKRIPFSKHGDNLSRE
jgi:hypothetical protein